MLFAARGRAIAALIEGDPVAWTILVVVILVIVGIAVVKAQMMKNKPQDDD
jgi:hypothetical protein